MKKVALIIFLLLMLGSFITFACTGKIELLTSKQNLDIKLLTGSGNDEIVWHIKNVKMTNQYLNETTRDIKKGEAITIEGESDSKTRSTPFFPGGVGGKKQPIFILEDTQGNQYKSQMEEVTSGKLTSDGGENDEFSVVFGIKDNGTSNESIRKWADLIIADPDDKNSNLPDHKVSLGAFDVGSNN
ncbi:MAG: DNA polymerase epsilon catalytic subunit A [Actinobacteria bacterium]|nr:DNA polymerase epsilon catalytic subunit A [Actinomycetota bacterium]MCL6093488.1 DNA polymerase epsilon catalytic subunit A [Actinomycetota bacterium]